ncbi:MAG: ABC transporter permease [Spirochaetales bacterium]|nr:MAG: ABC transporter permease [Spirochaetales bacterium]
MKESIIKDKIVALLKQKPQLVLLIVIVAVLLIINQKFSTLSNFVNILKAVSVISIISCGLTLVVISGALDLSVGSMLSLLNVVSATLQLKSDSAAVWVPFVIALFLGLFNGLIVSKFNVNSIIVTLGSLSIFGGLALLYVNGAIIIGRTGTWYTWIGQGKLLGIPSHIIAFLAIAVIFEIILSRTSFGRALHYIGTNGEAARIAGIKTGLIKTTAFIICALSVAVSSVIMSARMNSGSPVAGVGFEFDAITAIVIGGTSLAGGRGSIRNTVIGVLLLAVIINALTIYNVPFSFQAIVKGILIIVAITVDVKAREKYGK